MTAVACALFAVAVLALAWGVVTEFRQRRDRGPIAQVATLPFAWQSALLFTLALALLRAAHPSARIPWAMYPVVFLGTALAASALVLLAGRRPRRRRTERGSNP